MITSLLHCPLKVVIDIFSLALQEHRKLCQLKLARVDILAYH